MRLLLALLCIGSADAASVKIRVTATPTPSAIVSTEFRDGVDGAFGLWNIIPAQTSVQGTGYSANLCTQYLTQIGSPAAAITVLSGSLPTGWSLGGTDNCVLTYSDTGTGTALIRLRATRAGSTLPADSNEFRVEAVAGPSSDTTDPTIVTGCTVTNNTGSSSVTCDAPSDPYAGEAGSGIATIRSLHSAEGGVVFAASAGLSKELTLTNVGTISDPGAPTATPSGADWSVTAAGTGMVDSTADQMAFVGAQVAGSAFITAKLNSMSGAATNRSAGICARGDTSTNPARFCLRWQPVESATVGKLQLRGNASAGANKVTAATTNTLTLPLWLKLAYDGTTVTAFYSTTGNNWVAAGSYSVALGASPYWGLGVASGTAGTTTTADFDEVSLNNVTPFTRTFTTAGTVTFQATDDDGNEAAANAAVTVAPVIPVDSTAPVISVQPAGTSGGQTSINWVLGTFTDANGIRGYGANLYAGSSCAGSPTVVPEQVSNAYGQTGLTANTAYSLRSFAYDPTGNVAALSNCVTATTDAGAPPALTAPTGLAVNCTSTTSCDLTWNAVSGATGYRTQYKYQNFGGGYYTNPTTFTSLSAVINDPLDPGITYDFLICALNASTQVCTTVAVQGTTAPASGGGDGIKWHPGNYTGATEKGCTSTKNTVNTNLVNEVNGLAEFEGTLVIYNWGCLEQGSSNPGGTTAGDYSNGFALIDALLVRAAVGGKRLMVILTTHEYNTASTCDSGATIPTSQVPAYANSGGLLVKCAGYKWTSNWGSTAFVDRMKALNRAYGERYNDNPLVESFGFMEETAGINGLGAGGYASYATLQANLYALHADAAVYWPNTLIKFAVNYFGSDAQTAALINQIRTLPNIAFGVGDTYDEVWRSRKQPGSFIMRGLVPSSGAVNSSWYDYRGKHGFIAEIQSPDIGKQYGVTGGVCTSLTRTYNWAHDTLRHSHIVWTNNQWGVCTGTAFSGGVSGSATTEALAPDSSSGQSNSWTRQKSFVGLGTKVPYQTSCPTAYSACNTD